MLTGHEHFYEVFRKSVRTMSECRPVLDLGTPCRFRKELEPFAPLFAHGYFAMGYHAQASFGEKNVDVDGDVRRLPFADGVAGGAICIEVLEHVPEPQAAVDEIYRVLCPGGVMLLTTPFLSPYHGQPGLYGDFYRYTEEGLRWLLRRFRKVEIHALGGLPYRMVHTLAPAWLRELILGSRMAMGLLNVMDRRWPTESPLRWLVWGEK